MQPIKKLSRPITQATKTLLTPTTRKMSFFPGSFIAPRDTSFSPLFRLLEDFDNYSRAGEGSQVQGRHRTSLKTFHPKFDVKELADAYELHGELPGVEQKDVEIEFTDASTLTVKGRTERQYTSGTPPAGFIESLDATAAITESGEANGHGKAHKATVEDEEGATKDNTEVAKKDQTPPAEPEFKYWAAERSVGHFTRSFTFPARVDQDHVKASMKNGILSIVVPKAKKHESRKITIS
jgi:HSP20 family molecular chaperone IbpA